MEFDTLHFENQYLKGSFYGYTISGVVNNEHIHTINLGAIVPESIFNEIKDNLPEYLYDVRDRGQGIEFLSSGLSFDLDDANRYFQELCMILYENDVPSTVIDIKVYDEKLVDYWKLIIVAGIQVVVLIAWAYFTFDMQLGKFIREQSGSIYISDSSYASSALMPMLLLAFTFYVSTKLKVFNQYDAKTKTKEMIIVVAMSAIMAIIAAIMFINLQAQALQLGLSLFMNPIDAYNMLEYAGWIEIVNINLGATIVGMLIFYIPFVFQTLKGAKK